MFKTAGSSATAHSVEAAAYYNDNELSIHTFSVTMNSAWHKIVEHDTGPN